jgi:threonine/homoserine efflux transporter RhtA
MKNTNNTLLVWIAIAATGLIHFIEVPENLTEVPYKGVLFALNGLGSMLAAFLIFRSDLRGWQLGIAVAFSAALGYVLSRTIGLPLLPAEPDAWFEPLGITSLLVELAFLGAAATWYMTVQPQTVRNRLSSNR